MHLISEAAHQASLIPLLPLLLVFMWGGKILPAHLLVAIAFFMSWIGDSFAFFFNGMWDASYFWLPVQMGLMLLAMKLHRVLVLWAIAFATLLSFSVSFPGPELVITLLGSAGVLYLVRGPLTLPGYLYFGGGTVMYLAMVGRIGSEHFMGAWYGYQAFRLSAFVAFAVVVLHSHRNAYGRAH